MACIQPAETGEQNSGTAGHCRRVAALAVEVNRRAGLPSCLDPLLKQAAHFHHALDLILDSTPLGRLAWDVLCADKLDAASAAPAPVGPELRTVLSIFYHQPIPDAPEELRTLASILAICNLVDEQIEQLQFEFRGIDTILDEIQGFAALEGFDPALVDHLRSMRRPDALQSMRRGENLPVEARTAQRVYRALGAEREYEIGELESLAATDPVLAGSMIAVANSALYNLGQKIGTLGGAISYLGTVASRRVLLAAVLRPLFASGGLHRTWNHAVGSAQYCSALAAQTNFATPDEGLILGLLHDIGALAVEFLDRDTRDLRARLSQNGCPAAYTERLLLDADHGEIGAAILTNWRFPETLVEAVRFHHQPERTQPAAAAFLYLVEFWSGMDEDLPSFYRIEHCLDRTGLSLESMTQLPVKDNVLRALRFAA